MSPELRILSFGELDGSLWGVVVEATQGCFVLGSGERVHTGPATFEAAEPEGEWQARLGPSELVLTPAAEPVHESEGELQGLDQLCLVSGTVEPGGEPRALSCLGRRAVRRLPSSGKPGSMRDVSAWFDPVGGVALSALRPASAKGHDRDELIAAVLDPDAEERVGDPRLSTTYDMDGRPRRAGLELWLSDPEAEDQRLCRASGEVIGAGGEASCDGFRILAQPLSCHSRGREGAGIYLLLQPR